MPSKHTSLAEKASSCRRIRAGDRLGHSHKADKPTAAFQFTKGQLAVLSSAHQLGAC